MAPVPPRPTAGADDRAFASYYIARLKANPADSEAYLELGRIDERRGHYHLAAERILISRGLGEPDAKTAGPLGRCWMKLGRTEQALPELENAAKLNPNSHDAALNLAQLLAETGHGDKASAMLRYFLKHHPELSTNARPDQREAVERLMVAFVGLGEPVPALELARQAIRLAPDRPNGYAVAGRCLVAQSRWAEAEADLRKASELAPDNADLRYLHGVTLKKLARIEEALPQWQKAAELASLPGAYEELGNEYAKRKDWRRAAIGYLRAGSLTETDPALYTVAEQMCRKNGQNEMAVLCRARAAGLRSQHDAALKDYRSLAASKNPNMRKLGVDAAIEIYRALRRAPEYRAFVEQECRSGSSEDEMRLADCYGEIGDFDRRAEHLRRALAADPKLAGHVHHELGVAALNAGRRDEAESEMLKSIQAEPDKANHHRALARIYLDRRSLGDRLQRAVKAAERTVELSPDSAEDYHLLGTAYAAANMTPKAIRAFQRSIDLQPGYGPAYLDLGKLYAQVGDKTKSEETLQIYRKYQSFDLEKQTLRTRANANKNDPAAQVAMGDFYARANDFVHAQEQYKKAQRLAPNDPAIRAKVERAAIILGIAPGSAAKAGSR